MVVGSSWQLWVGAALFVVPEVLSVYSDRLPKLVWPEGLRMLPREMAGEVQTPVTGPAARELSIGDRVWARHTKAGEISEHLDSFVVVHDGRIVDEVPTYRGEGKVFL